MRRKENRLLRKSTRTLWRRNGKIERVYNIIWSLRERGGHLKFRWTSDDAYKGTERNVCPKIVRRKWQRDRPSGKRKLLISSVFLPKLVIPNTNRLNSISTVQI